MTRANARNAAIAAAVVGALVGLGFVVSSYPSVLWYLVLAAVGIMAYGALYVMVSGLLGKGRDRTSGHATPKVGASEPASLLESRR
jgi:hypothetical protein